MGYDEDNFCGDYLVLIPEEASFWDIVRYLLFDGDAKEMRLVKSPKEKIRLEGFRRRWLLVVSIVLQKVLIRVRKPLEGIGHKLEMWLNLLSSNASLGKLLLNFIQGKVEWPDKSSATFRTILAIIDERVELDKDIKPGCAKYNASLSMMAAKLSYENEAFVETIVRDHWKMKFLGFYVFWNVDHERCSTKAIMFQESRADPDQIVVAFRGTGPFDADGWRTDVDISWYSLGNVGKVHGGFMKALGLQKNGCWDKEIPKGESSITYYTIREKLRHLLQKNKGSKFIVTGHSLGGALAILFVGVLALHEEARLLERLEGVYTFGQPRVGDEQFGEFMKQKMKLHHVKYFRYVYCNDMEPRLPYDDKTLLFKHFGPCLYFNSCCYRGDVLQEEPNKNYFSLVWVLPKILNAIWELIRSFIIPYTKGPDYQEGWFLRMFRVIGLVIPGLSAHSPQDYHNVTRLGSVPSPLWPQDSVNQSVKLD